MRCSPSYHQAASRAAPPGSDRPVAEATPRAERRPPLPCRRPQRQTSPHATQTSVRPGALSANARAAPHVSATRMRDCDSRGRSHRSSVRSSGRRRRRHRRPHRRVPRTRSWALLRCADLHPRHGGARPRRVDPVRVGCAVRDVSQCLRAEHPKLAAPARLSAAALPPGPRRAPTPPTHCESRGALTAATILITDRKPVWRI